MINPTLNVPQSRFLALPHKFRGYVAGFGSGKTWAGSAGLMQHFCQFPRVNAGYFAPTYKLVKGVFYPTIEEVAHDWGFKVRIKLGDHEVHVSRGQRFYGVIHCRTMDNPGNIVGFKTGHALVDELDIMDTEKAELAWNKIIARMRYKVDGLKNGVDVTTTPEGFKFTYKKFKENPTKSYGLIQASTYDNAANLPDDYIDTLKETYPANLIDAYLDGQFVNLTSGTVYAQFDRKLNHTNREWNGSERIYIGCDFNVGRMCAVVHVIDEGRPRAVAEITGGYDTPDMIRMIKQQYWKETSEGVFEKTCQINVYPDSSGKNRKSVGAKQSDISLMRDAGFILLYKDANPAVKDRVNAMNAAFCNSTGERSYLVNTLTCPHYTKKLEQQVWKNGEPEKDGTEDVNDAGGYFIAYNYPIIRPVANIDVRF